MARDEIRIVGIEAFGHHGVLESERTAGQIFRIDISLHVDLADAGRTDDLAFTVDYGAVAQRVHDAVTGEPVDLIETLAERIADVCLSYSRVKTVEVTVNKPHAPIEVAFENVAVTIRRGE
jgi:dihydroneopterin aldolase